MTKGALGAVIWFYILILGIPYTSYAQFLPNFTSATLVGNSTAKAASARFAAGGQVVGFYFTATGNYHGYIFNNSNFQDVHPFWSPLIVSSDVVGITNNGDIVANILVGSAFPQSFSVFYPPASSLLPPTFISGPTSLSEPFSAMDYTTTAQPVAVIGASQLNSSSAAWLSLTSATYDITSFAPSNFLEFRAINNFYDLAGAAQVGFPGTQQAAVLFGATVPIYLALSPGYGSSSANDINDVFQIVGSQIQSSTSPILRCTFWDYNLGLNHVSILPFPTNIPPSVTISPTSAHTSCDRINNSGLVAGAIETSTGSYASYATVWDANNGIAQFLDTAPLQALLPTGSRLVRALEFDNSFSPRLLVQVEDANQNPEIYILQ